MSDEAQRIALAEHDGWMWKGPPGFECWYSTGSAYLGLPLFPEYGRKKEEHLSLLPNYIGSYSAIRRLILQEDNFSFRLHFMSYLCQLVANNSKQWRDQEERFTATFQFCLVMATPAQLAEAFLKAIDKWNPYTKIKP